MTEPVQVSVVMAVFNGADTLRDSVQSVLTQEGVEFEFIIVDDGSTDASGAMLDELAAQDSRIRVMHQPNQGLTRALIRGCAEARGKYIARQDAGDLFLPGKLMRQIEAFNANPEAALMSCGLRIVGPAGEILYEIVSKEGDVTQDLLTLDAGKVRGPFGHGSVLFRRDLYEKVGGYRREFYFGQDIDLWIRLAELGRHLTLPIILFQAAFSPNSISGRQRSKQVAITKAALESARLRRAGSDEAPALAQARAIVPDGKKASAAEQAAALYFMGACLSKRGDARARRYFFDALCAHPLYLKAAVRLLLG